MKKNNKKFLCLIMTSALLLALCLPSFAISTMDYNPEHLDKARTFLEITDENGVSNGQKINQNYDPDDPTTWRMGMYGFFFTKDGNLSRLFTINMNLVGSIDMSGVDTLFELVCYGGYITDVDVTGCTALHSLDIGINRVTHIEGLETCTAVAEIHVQENRLTELDLSGAGNVTQLYCYKNHLTQLDTSSMTAMTLLSCGNNPITALDLAANTALTELYCHDMQLESLDISALTNLQKVWCQKNRIKGHLDLTQDPNLLMVDTSGNRISSVDMYSSWYGETIHADNIGGGYVSITAESVLDNGAWTFPAVCVAEENEYVTFQYWLDNTTGEIVSTDAEFTVERGSVGNYTAVFQPIAEHLVFFMDRDGTMLSRQSVLHSGSAVAPEAPAREYYSFSGWAGGDYTCVTEDMVLVAQYSLNMIIGDVNYNGAVEIADAALALRAVMGLSQLDYEQQLAADLNSDGNVLASDAAGILRLVINK